MATPITTLWQAWQRLENWLLDGLLLAPSREQEPPTRPPSSAPEPSRSGSRPDRRQRGSRPGTTGPQASRARSGSQPPRHLPFELVGAFITLGLSHDADKATVRRRLRQLIKEAHPDRHPPERAEKAARRMRELTRARDTLRQHDRID